MQQPDVPENTVRPRARSRWIVAAGALLSIVSAAPSDAQSSRPEDAVLAVVQRMFDGMRNADSAMTRSTFAQGARFASVDARQSPPTMRYDSVDGWLTGIARSNRTWDEQIYDVQVKVDDGIAHVWAPYTFYLNKAVRHCGVNTIDLLRVGTDWKVVQLSDSRRMTGCPDPLKK